MATFWILLNLYCACVSAQLCANNFLSITLHLQEEQMDNKHERLNKIEAAEETAREEKFSFSSSPTLEDL